MLSAMNTPPGAVAAAPVPEVPLHLAGKNDTKRDPEFVNCTIGILPKFAREKVHAKAMNDGSSDNLRFSKQKPAAEK